MNDLNSTPFNPLLIMRDEIISPQTEESTDSKHLRIQRLKNARRFSIPVLETPSDTRILVVDYDLESLNTSRKLLEKLGYKSKYL